MVSETRAIQVLTLDGRQLDVRIAGRLGIPLILHHGTVGANTQFGPWVGAALARGLRVVTYSRPGCGSSSRAAGRTVSDCASDVARILDALEAERCLTIGPSGGGPHALAVAALLGDRTLACATVGSLAPYGMDDLDWFAGMGRSLVVTYSMAAAGDERGLVAFVEHYARTTGPGSPAALFDAQMPLAPVDVRALGGAFGAYLLDDLREALRNGPWGWVDDAMAFTRPWGFDPGSITVPMTVWHGDQDRMVPPAHGAWLGKRIPNAVLERLPQHGHASLAVDGFERILDDVMRAARLTDDPVSPAGVGSSARIRTASGSSPGQGHGSQPRQRGGTTG